MSRLSNIENIRFELTVMDFIDLTKPKKASDLSVLSENLHECIECAIEDYINDHDMDLDDYEGAY